MSSVQTGPQGQPGNSNKLVPTTVPEEVSTESAGIEGFKAIGSLDAGSDFVLPDELTKADPQAMQLVLAADRPALAKDGAMLSFEAELIEEITGRGKFAIDTPEPTTVPSMMWPSAVQPQSADLAPLTASAEPGLDSDIGKQAERTTLIPTRFTVTDEGVYEQRDVPKKAGKLHRLSSRIDVVAWARTAENESWSVVIEFRDRDSHSRQRRFPMSMFASSLGKIWSSLMSMGVWVSSEPEDRRALALYLQECKPAVRALLVSQSGWAGDAFVYPDGTKYGAADQLVIHEGIDSTVHTAFGAQGSLESWKDQVAALCTQNSRLVLATCVALAGPLLRPLGEENGGIHYCGASSIGKTTAIHVACSVWGNPDGLVVPWRATDSGLESMAASYSGTLLAMDELGEATPKVASAASYMLLNGQGRIRSNSIGDAQANARWSLTVISTGEVGLAEHLRGGGLTAKAGQEVRLIDVDADAGSGHGVFEYLHGRTDGAKLSMEISQRCAENHGTAGRALIAYLTEEQGMVRAIDVTKACIAKFEAEHVGAEDSGQVRRVARRFALFAAAGELAIKVGILPWPEGHCFWAASQCYQAWLEGRGGTGRVEIGESVELLRGFLLTYGATRFPLLKLEDGKLEAEDDGNAYGYRRDDRNGGTEYLIHSHVFKDRLCRGSHQQLVAQRLQAAGYLRTDVSGKKSAQVVRLPDDKRLRMYVISGELLNDEVKKVAA